MKTKQIMELSDEEDEKEREKDKLQITTWKMNQKRN